MRNRLGNLRDLVAQREHGLCQHCAGPGSDLHHALFRGPGGNVLDRVALLALSNGSFDLARHTAHLQWLCHGCHMDLAHGPDNVALGLRFLGQVRSERWSGRVFYEGPDGVLAGWWPKEDAA